MLGLETGGVQQKNYRTDVGASKSFEPLVSGPKIGRWEK